MKLVWRGNTELHKTKLTVVYNQHIQPYKI